METELNDVAIVGMGLALPGASSPEEFWRLCNTGAELFVSPPPDRWTRANFLSADPSEVDKTYQDRMGFLTGFRPDPDAAEACAGMEMTTAWLHHSLTQALRGVRRNPGDRTAFLVGYTPDGNLDLEQTELVASVRHRLGAALAADGVGERRQEEVLAAVGAVLADRYPRAAADPTALFPDRVAQTAMAGLLPEDTEVRTVDTACSSALYAIDIGIRNLRLRRCDLAVCGASFAFTARSAVMFAKLGGLSRRGEVRPFDDTADGVLFADGAGVLVLKRLRRALHDGDPVLAVVKSVGVSSDGRGTAIYAPNGAGQDRAVRKALAGPVTAEEVDWVIAHATGTPTGDVVEFATIGRHFTGQRGTYVSSNKSVIGHTGWSAGVASVIEAVLGLRRERIPPHIRLTAPRSDFRIEQTGLRIPTEAVPWPAVAGRPRTVGVSAFGFGGTNAHVVVREHAPGQPSDPPISAADGARRPVIVDWSALLPGLADRAAVSDWITGAGGGPAAGFGADYPMPTFDQVRLPPATVRMMDRSQVMAMQCAHELSGRLRNLWRDRAWSAGVFVGHSGPTRVAMLLANRVYLDDVADALRSDRRTGELPELAGGLERLHTDVRAGVGPVNEDSYPGTMPNIIAARVANRFDLHGPNITLDAGLESGLVALDTAVSYLCTGELDLALVAGVHGNTLPEFTAGPGGLAEGAVMFAVTTEELAGRYDLPVLAHVGAQTPVADQQGRTYGAVVECGPSAPGLARYVGAASAFGVLDAVHRDPARVSVRCSGPAGRPGSQLDLTIPARGEEPEPVVRRHVVRLRSTPADPAREPVPSLAAGLVLLTDQPDLAAALPLPADATILSVASTGARPGWTVMLEPNPEAVRRWLAARDAPVRHLRLLTRLDAAEAAASQDTLLALHDAAFLTVQATLADLAEPGSSFVTVLLGGLVGRTPAALAGLFTGLVKVVGLELDGCQAFVLSSTSTDPAVGTRQADREGALRRTFPVVHYDGDERLVPHLVDLPAEPGPAVLTEDSVVVTVGGARGITAEVTKELARVHRCRIYVLGSGRLTDEDATTWAEVGGSRPAFIRQRLAEGGPVSVAELNSEFDRLANAEATRDTLATLAEHCGAGRARYLRCDVTDPASVDTAVAEVLARSGSVDLLVHAAGRNRSALIADKRFAEFIAIRDIKARGYWNLKRAFGDRQPRIWCNFGSLLGHFGQKGESDYTSGNDFLASAATAAAARGAREYTVGWTLWDGAGMGGQSGSLADSYFKRTDAYSKMGVAEGIRHFMAELGATEPAPAIVHIGAIERRTMDKVYSGYLDQPSPRGRFYLRGVPGSSSGRSLTFEVPFDLSEDRYLHDHLVRGIPTLPGAFVTEIAAEVAVHLVPELKVIGFADSQFERFLHVHPDVASPPKRVTARVVAEADGVTEVEVAIVGDVRSPGGVLLVRDRPHFRTRVLLADRFPDSPRARPWPDPESDRPAAEPLAAAGSTITLTGLFRCLHDIRAAADRARATYRLDDPGDHPLAVAFIMPVFLFDGLVRTSFVGDSDGRPDTVRTPMGVAAIERYAEGNDWDLVDAYGALDLYATGDGHTVALAPDGRVVARISGVNSAVLRW